MGLYYTSMQEYKEANPEHKYFASRMQEHPNTEWMVCHGNPSDANGKLASEKWSIVSMMMNHKEAAKLAEELNTYPHNLKIGDEVIYQSDKPQGKFFNGKKAVVSRIAGSSITVKFNEDSPLLPTNKELNLMTIYLVPVKKAE